MNGLVEKKAPTFGQVLLRWRCRVTTNRTKLIQAAQHARLNPALRFRIPRVETALKTNLERHPFLGDSGKRLLRSGEIQRHRFLAKDGLTGFRRRFDQGSVGIGGCTNDDGINILSVYRLLRRGSYLFCAN